VKTIEVGTKVRFRDVGDLMEWIEKRIMKSSKEPMDCVWLPLVVAEATILIEKKSWRYDEPVEEAIASVRLCAQEFAKATFGKVFADDESGK